MANFRTTSPIKRIDGPSTLTHKLDLLFLGLPPRELHRHLERKLATGPTRGYCPTKTTNVQLSANSGCFELSAQQTDNGRWPRRNRAPGTDHRRNSPCERSPAPMVLLWVSLGHASQHHRMHFEAGGHEFLLGVRRVSVTIQDPPAFTGLASLAPDDVSGSQGIEHQQVVLDVAAPTPPMSRCPTWNGRPRRCCRNRRV